MNIVGEIKWYLGDDYAQIKFSESKEAFSIDTVMVPAAHRSKGVGSQMIRHILTLADGLAKKVHVSARPIGNVSEERLQRLIKFYQQFGFYQVDRGHSIAYLVRDTQPKSSIRPPPDNSFNAYSE
ncbi:MAG: GNAT family N-acetyltransferase [Proteobacteria bacterium]|nr:GNAT family N-acetyltransferase [Pseudomonadota bacterium]MBU1688633.1 GNAT family N-acetyltransferase [Pseudomonadota bacterium]